MITVTAATLERPPRVQEFNLYGWHKLTPKAARAALELAFKATEGEVWANDYGYRVYPQTARKLTRQQQRREG